MFFQKFVDTVVLLILKLALLLFLTNVVLEVVKLFLCGPLALLVVKNGLRNGLYGSISNGNEYRFL